MAWVVKTWHAREVAETYFDGLEQLGAQLTADVREQRAALQARRPSAAPPARRASLRASPLAELFRATVDPPQDTGSGLRPDPIRAGTTRRFEARLGVRASL
jgi:hypothetical protein